MVLTRVTTLSSLVQTHVTSPILLNNAYLQSNLNQQYLTLYIQKISQVWLIFV